MGRPQVDPSSYNQVTEADDIHQPPTPPPPPYEVFNVETYLQECSYQSDSISNPIGSTTETQNQQQFQPPPQSQQQTFQQPPLPQAYHLNPQLPAAQPVQFQPQFPQNQQPALSYQTQNPQTRITPRSYPPPPPPQAQAVQFPPPPSQAVQFPPPPPPQATCQQQPPPHCNNAAQFASPPPQMTMFTPTMQPSALKPHGNVAPGIPLPGGWSTGLFDCLDDPENALVTACFPCVTFGQIAEIIDGGNTSCATSGMLYGLIAFAIGLPFLISCSYRTKLRTQYGLVESPASDWLTHCLCEWCALCQEYRELKHRGFEPSIGWHGNLAKIQQQQQQVVLMPPANQTMMG